MPCFLLLVAERCLPRWWWGQRGEWGPSWSRWLLERERTFSDLTLVSHTTLKYFLLPAAHNKLLTCHVTAGRLLCGCGCGRFEWVKHGETGGKGCNLGVL